MVEPSESARRIESVFARLQVPLEGELAKPDILTHKKAMGLALPAFVERLREELEGAELTANGARIAKLKLKQLETMSEGFAEAAPGDQFEPDELGLVAIFMELVIALLGGILKKEFRGA